MHFLSVPKENDNGDKEAKLNRLMDEYGNDVLRTAMLYLKNRESAEDAFQEVFIKVYKNLDSFRNESSEKTWILSITINVCRDILRSSWLKKVLLTEKFNTNGGRGNPDIENKIIKRDESRILMDEVSKLPRVFKEVIILYYYQGFDTGEISKIVKAAEGTVRSRLHRARDLLKNKMEGRLDWLD